MNRKLHNSLNAAMACSALLTMAVLAGAPAGQPAPSATAIAATSPASAPAGATVVATTAAEPAGAIATGNGRRVPRRSYQSVRMPFFSFFLPQG